MAPYYRTLTGVLDPSTSTSPPTNTNAPMPFDVDLYNEMLASNKQTLDEFEKKLEEAEKTEGESDIADILRNKAMYLVRIGDKVCSKKIVYFRFHKLMAFGSVSKGKGTSCYCHSTRKESWSRFED